MTKPRTGWKILPGGASARRGDGITAGFCFLGSAKPYAVYRKRQSERLGIVDEYMRTAVGASLRSYSTLQTAMEAADRYWPVEGK